MSGSIVLNVYRGQELLFSRRFARDIIKIGRQSSAHLCLDDPTLSGVHAVVEVAHDGTVSIIDMGSAQGTRINGRRVSRSRLEIGDEITLGGLRIVLERNEASVSACLAVAPPASAPVMTLAPASAPEEPSSHMPARAGIRKRRAVSTTHAPQGGDLGVELRMLWGETLLDAGVFVRPEHPVLAGLTKNCQFLLTGSNLPAKEFPILRFDEGEYQVLFARGMEGEVEEKGSITPLSQFMKGSLAATDVAVEGTYAVSLPATGAVRVQFGSGISMEASLQRKPEPATLPWYQGINYRFLNVLLLLFFLMGGLVIVASNYAYDADLLGDELRLNPLWVKIKLPDSAVQPKSPVRPQESPSQLEQMVRKLTARHSGEEGIAGQLRGPDVVAHRASRGDQTGRDSPSTGSLVTLLGRGRGGISAVIGDGTLGRSLVDAIGRISGGPVGDSRGIGLGIKGDGKGGGGLGNSVGIDPIDTKTGIEGWDKVRKPAGGIGTPTHVDPEPPLTPKIDPNYDASIVRRVVRDHAGQIRACYERQLLANPQLEGKVVIRWQINANGSVSDVQTLTDYSTIGDRALQQCMMGQIAKWNFPAPKAGGVAVIQYPWVLRPAGG